MENPTSVILKDDYIKHIQDLYKKYYIVDKTMSLIDENTSKLRFSTEISEAIALIKENLIGTGASNKEIEEFALSVEKLKRQIPLNQNLIKLVITIADKIENLSIAGGPDAVSANNRSISELTQNALRLENNDDKEAIKELKSIKKEIDKLKNQNTQFCHDMVEFTKMMAKKFENIAFDEDRTLEKYSGKKSDKLTFLPKLATLTTKEYQRMQSDLIKSKDTVEQIKKECGVFANTIKNDLQSLSTEQQIRCKEYVKQLGSLATQSGQQLSMIETKDQHLVECLSDVDKEQSLYKKFYDLCKNEKLTAAVVLSEALTKEKHPFFMNNTTIPNYVTLSNITDLLKTSGGYNIIRTRIQQNPAAFVSALSKPQENISHIDLEIFAKALLDISKRYENIINEQTEKITRIEAKIKKSSPREAESFTQDLTFISTQLQKIAEEKNNFENAFKDQLAQLKEGKPIVLKHVTLTSAIPTIIPVIQQNSKMSDTPIPNEQHHHDTHIPTLIGTHKQKDWSVVEKDDYFASKQNLSTNAPIDSSQTTSISNDNTQNAKPRLSSPQSSIAPLGTLSNKENKQEVAPNKGKSIIGNQRNIGSSQPKIHAHDVIQNTQVTLTDSQTLENKRPTSLHK